MNSLTGSNKFNRATEHLGEHAGAFAEDCIQAVEDIFEGAWLRKNNGHRLQMLWARRDRLATSELYALGKAIRKLQPKHSMWLDSTARSLKKNVFDSHGLITEILVCGSISGKGNAVVFPSKKSEPGIDLSVRFSDGFCYVISVKNHDISVHEKAFQRYADCLRETFNLKLRELGTNGKLVVMSDDYINQQDFGLCSDFLRNHLVAEGLHEIIPGKLALSYTKMRKEERDFAKTFTSSAVIICCGQHPNEQLNFRNKLLRAADNMKKHAPMKANRFRLLKMRVHASADILGLEKAAQELIDADSDCGLDGVLLTQSSVVRSGDRSQIHTVLRYAFRLDHPGYVNAVTHGNILGVEFGIGSVGNETIETQLTNGEGLLITMPRDRYIYQRTDYYFLMKKDANGFSGNIESPASGVHYHAVMEMDDTEFVLQAISPVSEDVLIV